LLPASNTLSRSHALTEGLDGRDKHGHDDGAIPRA
jgi:hypothetical protein